MFPDNQWSYFRSPLYTILFKKILRGGRKYHNNWSVSSPTENMSQNNVYGGFLSVRTPISEAAFGNR